MMQYRENSNILDDVFHKFDDHYSYTQTNRTISTIDIFNTVDTKIELLLYTTQQRNKELWRDLAAIWDIPSFNEV